MTAPKANLRELAGVPDGYQVLFLQGGATLEFALLAMDLRLAATADYIETGGWSEKAIAHTKRLGKVHVTGSRRPTNHPRIPAGRARSVTASAPAYVHMTVEQHDLRDPVAHGGRTSGGDAGQRRLVRHSGDRSKYPALGMIYGGREEPVDRRESGGRRAQGPARQGARHDAGLLNSPLRQGALALQHAAGVGIVSAPGARSISARGGLAAVEAQNLAQGGEAYAAIDAPAEVLPRPCSAGKPFGDQRDTYSAAARKARQEVRRHRPPPASRPQGASLGRQHRASIYNAFPEAASTPLSPSWPTSRANGEPTAGPALAS